MPDLTDLGFGVGHWTDAEARTGCTVILCPENTVASAEVRGGAPASRELELLDPQRMVSTVDAVLLTGGSAFGLAAADGVMRYCEERGRGVPTPGGRVPIVPALALFDLAVGDSSVRPGPDEGYDACLDAEAGSFSTGRIGAGTGASTGHWRGPDGMRPGMIQTATFTAGDLIVSALVVVNAFGEVDADGTALAAHASAMGPGGLFASASFTNTTIGFVATNARLDKSGCLILAQGAHDGLARAIVPPHTRFDGDAFIAASAGDVVSDLDTVRMLGVAAVEKAIRDTAPTGKGAAS
ncbi:P1 family peptidase [Phytomonospora sp. NPDC050363]|uniref:P1 family peptidase n=1 Tax=Phytomonospora sp. NPDC050363 TaxID=3155642 RepID=UPI0033FCAC7F